MSRWFLVFALTGIASAQLAGLGFAQAPVPKPPAEEQVQLPPEEDKSDVPRQYAFNPLQAKKEVTVGEFYFKKSDFRAAEGRFREATRWNDGNSEAWLRLGEAAEKNHEPKVAREAYEKYLQLTPQAKNASDVKKRIEKLKG